MRRLYGVNGSDALASLDLAVGCGKRYLEFVECLWDSKRSSCTKRRQNEKPTKAFIRPIDDELQATTPYDPMFPYLNILRPCRTIDAASISVAVTTARPFRLVPPITAMRRYVHRMLIIDRWVGGLPVRRPVLQKPSAVLTPVVTTSYPARLFAILRITFQWFRPPILSSIWLTRIEVWLPATCRG